MRPSESTEPVSTTPRSTWVLMVIAALLGVVSVVAIPQFIKAQARREVAQLKAQVRTQPMPPADLR